MSVDCEQCGKRIHVFWQDTVGKFIDYLRQSRPFADKIYVISHNSRGYDAQFLLRRFLELRWAPQLIMDGSKILACPIDSKQLVSPRKPWRTGMRNKGDVAENRKRWL